MPKNKLLTGLLTLSNVFFLLLYVTLCVNNRLAIDDFHFLANINEHGVIRGTIVEYNTWSSRWISVFLNHSILLLNEKIPVGLTVFGLFNLLFFSVVVFFFMKILLQTIHRPFGNRFTATKSLSDYWWIANLSVFLVSVIFISTIKIDETWFWLCASTTYLWSNSLFLLGFACLFMPTKNRLLTLLGYFSFFYIGGSAGPLALIALFILGILFISTYFNFIFPEKRSLILKRSFFSILFCFISFVILYVAPGNQVRERFFEEISIGYSFILNTKMVGIIVLNRLPAILPFIVVLALPMVSFSQYFKGENSDAKWKTKLLCSVLVYGGLVYLYQLPITYKTQDVGAFRALFFITVLTVLFFLYLYYLVGTNSTLSQRVKSYLYLIPFLTSSVLFGYTFMQQYTLTTEYAKKYDERMEYIESKRLNYTNEVLELPPLPPSGMLFSAELSTDTSHFSNQHLKKALRLDFALQGSEEGKP